MRRRHTGFGGGRVDRRTFLVGAATVAASLGAAACGTNIGGGGSGGGSSSGGKVTLTHYYHQYGEKGTQQAVERYAQQYMKQNSNVEIKVQWVPGDYTTKLNTALVGPNPPDVFESGQPTLQNVKQGQAVALDDIFDGEKNDYFPNVQALNTINGHIYGAKIVTDVGLLYYRKSMLKSAGVAPPTTAAELISAAKTLTRGKVKGLFLGDDGGVAALYQLLGESAGAKFVDNGKVGFATQAAAEAYQVLVELNRQGSLLIGYQPDYLQPDAFINGLVAMQWTGLWVMPAVKAALKDDFGVVPLPKAIDSGKPVSFLGGWTEVVNGHSKHVAEAKKYVKWLWVTNKSVQRDFNLSYGFHLPPRKSIAESAAPLKSGPAKDAVNILDKYAVALGPMWDVTMDTALQDAVSQIVQKRADVPTSLSLLQTAQQKAQAELDQELKG